MLVPRLLFISSQDAKQEKAKQGKRPKGKGKGPGPAPKGKSKGQEAWTYSSFAAASVGVIPLFEASAPEWQKPNISSEWLLGSTSMELVEV